MTGISGGSVSASFVYDADGNRVKGTVGGVNTVYIAGLYEYSGGVAKSYYTGPGGVVAMRSGGVVYYLLSDQLNSTARIVNTAGTIQDTNYFFPFGGNRGAAFTGLTTKRFTGQYHESSIPGGEGLYYYNARWYDAKLGRFTSADTLVPDAGNPQSFNRYAYVLNNPLKYVDPTGHFWWIAAGAAVGGLVAYGAQVYNNTQQGMDFGAALTTDIDGMAIVAGALAGASAVAMAPLAVAMAGDALAGAGLLTGSTGLFSAGMSAGGVAGSMATAIYGVSTVQTAGLESGYKTAKNNVTWSQLGETEAGGTVWGSDRDVWPDDVHQLVDDLLSTGSKDVTILSGTHGDVFGRTGVEDPSLSDIGFYLLDTKQYTSVPYVKVLNVLTTSTAQQQALTGQVVCAWCFSDISNLSQGLARR